MITTAELTVRLTGIVREITAAPVTPETDLLDAGLDSLGCVELIHRVEEELGLSCTFEDVLGCATVTELTERIEGRSRIGGE